MACYLSVYLNVPLPRDIIFLGEVHNFGGLFHPLPVNNHYLDFCLEEGFTRIVGPSDRLQALRGAVNQAPYQGIELIELNNAAEIVPELFELLL